MDGGWRMVDNGWYIKYEGCWMVDDGRRIMGKIWRITYDG